MPRRTKKARYEQSTDATLAPFLSSSASLIGEQAMNAEISGKSTSAQHVRVRAEQFSQTHMGQGLHELVPTNLHPEISKIPNSRKRTREAAAEVQSGARTTPALTPFYLNGQVLGHTGTFVNPKKKGASTHTSGQAASHEELRNEFRASVNAGIEGTEFAVRMVNAQLAVMPAGHHIMEAHELTGAQPNLNKFGPLEDPNSKVRTNRIGFAQITGTNREEVKARNRALKHSLTPAQQKRTRSPSPERRPIDKHGKGGGYISNPKRSRVAPMPDFPATHKVAEQAAFVMQPLRLKK